MRFALLTTTMLTAAALTLSACGGDKKDADAAVPPPVATTPSTPPPATTPETTTPAAETALSDVKVKSGECADVPAASPKSPDTPEPTGKLDAGVRNILVLKTSCGTIKIELDAKNDPKTANAVATLAKAGYYDGTAFHRTVEGFVIQGGDPNGDGTGGPAWKTVEEPPADTKYTEGVVAMAKTGAEAPGTSGSQFFIVTGADVGLPPEYAVAGKVVKGQDIATLISKQGTKGADGPPTKPILILSAKLQTKK